MRIRIRMFMDLPDPDSDPIIRGTDPNPAPDSFLPFPKLDRNPEPDLDPLVRGTDPVVSIKIFKSLFL